MTLLERVLAANDPDKNHDDRYNQKNMDDSSYSRKCDKPHEP